MTGELFPERAADLLARNVTRIQRQLSSGHAKSCTICGSVEFDGWGAESQAGYREYLPSCNCGEAMSALEFYVTVRAQSAIRLRDTIIRPCPRECDHPMLAPELTADTLAEAGEFALPVPEVLNNRVVEHHLSYEPEITVPVCSQCHGRIHSSSDELQAFEPDMTRTEWESQ